MGSLTIQGHDEAALPSGIRAFAAVHPRTSKRRSATFEIYVGVNNLTPGAAGDAHASSAPTDLEFRIRGVGRYTLDEIDYPLPPTDRECTKLNHLGANADDPTFSFEYFDLARQASAGEAVLDHVIHDRYKCPGSEVPEPGEGPG
ncbi:MAG TPA: hypothetical protein VKR21_18165 [Solirubrobacteraceae bacterium]|nr:hypothetical protein [Solirubrobacteraceae bacterium]